MGQLRFSWVVVHSQRLLWDHKWEMVCSASLWMKLIDDAPASIMVHLANVQPFTIGPIKWRLETPIEASVRLDRPKRSMVPAIARKRDEDR